MDYHPEIQHSFEDRLNRFREFKGNNTWLPEIYVDLWDDQFELTFQSWPDKYYLINSDFIVLQKSEYNYDAQLINDYADLL